MADDIAQTNINLLICTVGGSAEPIVASLKGWQPARILFVPSADTMPLVDSEVIPLARQEGLVVSPGCYEICVLPDGQDVSSCMERIRTLNSEVERWLNRGTDYQVVVDFTGGTKCMSAALAVQATRWRCLFSYIGGEARTKDGTGIVVSGKEQRLQSENPWELLGYHAVEQAITLFDQGAYRASGRLLEETTRSVRRPERKRELMTLKRLTDAYDSWDRFNHREANNRLAEVEKSANDLRAILASQPRADLLLNQIAEHREHLRTLDVSEGPTTELVADLLGNAGRRIREGRFDDAVARLYRALEAIAQHRLRKEHQIDSTSNVPLAVVPEALRSIWQPLAKDGNLKIGLQDAYQLLLAFDDPVGAQFSQLGLDDRSRSPLSTRNASILAHGFQPVSEKVCDKLWEAALQLSGFSEAELPAFPCLGVENAGA